MSELVIPQKVFVEAPSNGDRPSFSILRLNPNVSNHWILMPQFLSRLETFISDMHLDSPPATVQQYVRAYWAAGNEQVAIWVGVADPMKVVAHALTTIEYSWGVPYAMIVQMQVDHPHGATLEQRQQIMADIDSWAVSQKASCIKMLTPRKPEAWTRLAGFTLDKYLMRKELS